MRSECSCHVRFTWIDSILRISYLWYMECWFFPKLVMNEAKGNCERLASKWACLCLVSPINIFIVLLVFLCIFLIVTACRLYETEKLYFLHISSGPYRFALLLVHSYFCLSLIPVGVYTRCRRRERSPRWPLPSWPTAKIAALYIEICLYC